MNIYIKQCLAYTSHDVDQASSLLSIQSLKQYIRARVSTLLFVWSLFKMISKQEYVEVKSRRKVPRETKGKSESDADVLVRIEER